ncbi:hypothetical protein J6590_005976 [Homalodisca vitripennis]|nr:hypothetical protein J6590_005976 [Homalodisca vitripennis]
MGQMMKRRTFYALALLSHHPRPLAAAALHQSESGWLKDKVTETYPSCCKLCQVLPGLYFPIELGAVQGVIKVRGQGARQANGAPKRSAMSRRRLEVES